MNITRSILANKQNIPQPSLPNPVNSLPQEVIALILLNADDMAKQQASCVNKIWSASSIEAAKNNELFMVYNCIKLLQNHDTEKNEIFKALENQSITKSINLQQVKTSSNALNEQIINILKNIDKNDLIYLDIFHKNNLVNLARLYKDIEIIDNTEKDEFNKDFLIMKKLVLLITHNQLDKAVDTFKKLTPRKQLDNIDDLIKLLRNQPIFISVNPLSKLLETLMNNDETLLSELMTSLLFCNNFLNEIPKFAATSPGFVAKYPAFAYFLGTMLNYTKNDSNLEIARDAKDIASKLPSNILSEISISLFENEKKEEAKKVANEIPDLILKKSTLKQIKDPSKSSCAIM